MEIFRALGLLAEPPGERHGPVAAALGIEPLPLGEWKAAYTDVFLMQCYPYASVYLGEEGMLGGEARDRIAGFWRALGLTPPPEPDHLAALLGFHAGLCQSDGSAAARAQAAFLWEHLLSWLPPYLDKVKSAGSAVYADWAALLYRTLAAEAERLGLQPRLPLHLREAPALTAPAVGDEALLRALLAPARSGVLLTRSDLARLCRERGLGLRMGERRFVLEKAIAQDAGGVLAWLGEEARSAAVAHRRHAVLSGPIARFWSDRAAATASLLDGLAATCRSDASRDNSVSMTSGVNRGSRRSHGPGPL